MLDREKLQECLELHQLWIKGEPMGARANLRGAYLQGADLWQANLQEADLQGANLWGANLQGANLQEANLQGANLQEAYLQRANLWGANLQEADLQGANLWGANLQEADLWQANLQEADLQGANLQEADLWQANLQQAYLQRANLLGANLRGANLWEANLQQAYLQCADLRRANLRGANLRGAKLDGVKVSSDTSGFHMHCPEIGEFMAVKKCVNGDLVTLKIPEDAKRSSATTNKCRCDKALVVAIEDVNGCAKDETISCFDGGFIYKVGEVVRVSDFDDDRWHECAAGIHFFLTKKEAALF